MSSEAISLARSVVIGMCGNVRTITIETNPSNASKTDEAIMAAKVKIEVCVKSLSLRRRRIAVIPEKNKSGNNV